MKIDVQQLLAGNRRTLARAITLIESQSLPDREATDSLLREVLPHSGRSIRIGISGAPGVGKSTFIDALGMHLIDRGHKIAVLAIDPSSPTSGGSILGDKLRMQRLSSAEQAYVRPSPAGEKLGGVASRTRDIILCCEATGFEIVIVETVGVGQSESSVAGMVDLFVILLQPASGDEIQGIKRGILDLVDLAIVNKADGELVDAAERTAEQFRAAFSMSHHDASSRNVQTCSALEGTGIAQIWSQMETEISALKSSGEFDSKRNQQRVQAMNEMFEVLLRREIVSSARIRDFRKPLETMVAKGEMSASQAASKLASQIRNAIDAASDLTVQ